MRNPRQNAIIAVNVRCSNKTVTRSFSTKQIDDELNLQSKPSQNQMKRSKRIAVNLNKIINLRSQLTASALELTRIEEDENENEFNNDQFIHQ